MLCYWFLNTKDDQVVQVYSALYNLYLVFRYKPFESRNQFLVRRQTFLCYVNMADYIYTMELVNPTHDRLWRAPQRYWINVSLRKPQFTAAQMWMESFLIYDFVGCASTVQHTASKHCVACAVLVIITAIIQCTLLTPMCSAQVWSTTQCCVPASKQNTVKHAVSTALQKSHWCIPF